MSAARRDHLDSDALAVRRAARQAGARITAVSTAGVAVVILLAVLFVLDQSRPAELLEPARAGQDKIDVDSNELLLVIAALGVVAVVVAGVTAAIVARHAVRPLGEALRLQREFVADASHELRTPIAILDTRLQSMERALPVDGPLAPVVTALRSDSRSLAGVVSDLLVAAELPEHAGQRASADLGAVTRAAIADLNVIAQPRTISIVCDLDDDQPVPISATSLRRCVFALVDNAIGHAPDGSTITLTQRVSRRSVALLVSDEGAGIPRARAARLYERFDHDDARSTPGRRGFGIGLALVRDIAVRSGGDVAIDSTSEQGTTMRLELPHQRHGRAAARRARDPAAIG